MSVSQAHGRSAQIDDLAVRLLVAAYTTPVEADDERDHVQWAKEVVPLVFTIAEIFFAEVDRRQA